jgi:hypothetical protein
MSARRNPAGGGGRVMLVSRFCWSSSNFEVVLGARRSLFESGASPLDFAQIKIQTASARRSHPPSFPWDNRWWRDFEILDNGELDNNDSSRLFVVDFYFAIHCTIHLHQHHHHHKQQQPSSSGLDDTQRLISIFLGAVDDNDAKTWFQSSSRAACTLLIACWFSFIQKQQLFLCIERRTRQATSPTTRFSLFFFEPWTTTPKLDFSIHRGLLALILLLAYCHSSSILVIMYNLFKGKRGGGGGGAAAPQLRRSSSDAANGAATPTNRPGMTLGGGGGGGSTSLSILRGGGSSSKSINGRGGSLARSLGGGGGVPVTPAAASATVVVGGGRPGQVMLQRVRAPVQQQRAATTTTADQQTQGVISMEEGTLIFICSRSKRLKNSDARIIWETLTIIFRICSSCF